MIVLDTNVVSGLMRPDLNPAVVAWVSRQNLSQLRISAVSMEELDYGIARLPNGRKKRAVQAQLRLVEQSALGRAVLSLTRDAAHRSAVARAAAMRATGHCSVPDAMIAGIALANGASVATRNVAHFRHFGVPLIDPWSVV